ncbi:hypothetical protein [Paenibacillus sp. Root444D2]|uniref:hypothetical protein n=1 Tax=Paenibacillus sp. Root444D2 TaxID=1736538 RepID=UPI000710368F|nr:hypothetical protein [Paenibacillus sp. Root444D2]KQX48772.1 hypothetical protein ASD40_11425 [Paenibacillus sp. Root444D2]
MNPTEVLWLDLPNTQKNSSGASIVQLESKWMSIMARVITGEAPLDTIDAVVEDWKKNGGDELSKEVNQLYQQWNEVRLWS